MYDMPVVDWNQFGLTFTADLLLLLLLLPSTSIGASADHGADGTWHSLLTRIYIILITADDSTGVSSSYKYLVIASFLDDVTHSPRDAQLTYQSVCIGVYIYLFYILTHRDALQWSSFLLGLSTLCCFHPRLVEPIELRLVYCRSVSV